MTKALSPRYFYSMLSISNYTHLSGFQGLDLYLFAAVPHFPLCYLSMWDLCVAQQISRWLDFILGLWKPCSVDVISDCIIAIYLHHLWFHVVTWIFLSGKAISRCPELSFFVIPHVSSLTWSLEDANYWLLNSFTESCGYHLYFFTRIHGTLRYSWCI